MTALERLQKLLELDARRREVARHLPGNPALPERRFLSKEEYELEHVFNQEARAAMPALRLLIEGKGHESA